MFCPIFDRDQDDNIAATYLMLIRYWARATDSQFPVMVMVLSRLAGASLSSQFEMRIMAPESCLRGEKTEY